MKHTLLFKLLFLSSSRAKSYYNAWHLDNSFRSHLFNYVYLANVYTSQVER